MLYIHLRKPDNVIRAVDRWFNRNKCKDWFNNEVVKEIIYGIDKTVAVKDEYLESPKFGGMSPDRLSTGCKAVISMYVQDERPVWGTSCGENCIPYIIKVASLKDVHIYLEHCMKFPLEFDAYLRIQG